MLVSKVAATSKNLISSPIVGEAGRVAVTAPPDVSTKYAFCASVLKAEDLLSQILFALLVPVIEIFPVPVILFDAKLRLPPKLGEASPETPVNPDEILIHAEPL